MAKSLTKYHYVVVYVIAPIIGALIIIMNLLKLYVIKRNQQLRKSVSIIYLINVSISDLTVGILTIIYKSMHPYKDYNDVTQELYYIIKLCFIRISLFVSVFNMVALTINQTWAIRKPFIHRKYGKKLAIKICCGVWMISITFVAGLYLAARFKLHNTRKYTDVVFASVTYPATITFIICYSMIFLTVRKSAKKNAQIPERVQKAGKGKVDKIEVSRTNFVISCKYYY